MTNWTKNRRKALRILEMTAMVEFGMELCDLPDLPCIVNALDTIEALMEEHGNDMETLMAEIRHVTQETMEELEAAMETEPSYI